jgi:hypothetical protein
MRLFVLGLIACAALFAVKASAQMDFQLQADGKLVAFAVKELAPQDNGLPVAKVRLAKVVMRNGAFDRELLMPLNEMNQRVSLLKKKFKLYRGPMRVGIYTYEAVPEENKSKSGEDYLRAIPVSKDATIQALTANTKEQADILSLLNMTVEEAAAAAKSESKLDEILAKATADEIALLQKGKLGSAPLLFIPVNARK